MEWIAISIVCGIAFVLSAAVQIVKMGLAHEEKRLALKHGQGQGDTARLEQILAATQTEMARLKDRVQVLEKLATDDDRRLASDIERLRSVVVGGYVIKMQKMKLEEKRITGASSAVQDETAREVQKLKDRVAVLERLMTDDDRKLAGEIERLRREDARG